MWPAGLARRLYKAGDLNDGSDPETAQVSARDGKNPTFLTGPESVSWPLSLEFWAHSEASIVTGCETTGRS